MPIVPAAVARLFRRCLALTGLAALSACAGHQIVDNGREAAHYAAVAPGHYVAPGPHEDPWGPYVTEAAARYDVPTNWVRAVMKQESGGHEYAADGSLITSAPGAMGLMQVMPETYDELKGRYALGDDPYDPHNNILAGTAYLREMYDLYGSPGFLAAYNAGPARLDKYLAGTEALPDETRHYVAAIAPEISGAYPASRSGADQLALNQLPDNIAPGLRYARSYAVASRHRGRSDDRQYASARGRGFSRYASLGSPSVARVAYRMSSPPPGNLGEAPRLQLAYASPRASHGFHLINTASAEVMPLRAGSGGSSGWAIQVGAFASQSQAAAAASTARTAAAASRMAVGAVHQAHGTLYRARLVGLSREGATAACERLGRGHCIILSPAAQS